MLVRFNSDVGGFTMFGDVAVRLLRMAGHSGTVPGAIPEEEIGDALQRLEAAMESHVEPPRGASEEEGEPPVSLRQRAFPLIELLRNAAREPCGVMWDRA